MMALKGEVFCKSAHDAYYLLKRNSMLSDITDGIGEMFAILANLFIGLGAAMCGYGMIISITQYQSVSPILPTLVLNSIISIVFHHNSLDDCIFLHESLRRFNRYYTDVLSRG